MNVSQFLCDERFWCELTFDVTHVMQARKEASKSKKKTESLSTLPSRGQ